MNFADIAKLTGKNIQSERIIYKRSKVGKVISVKLNDKINAILDIYKKEKNIDDYIFPVITDEQSRNLQIKNYRDSANHALKCWAKKLELDPTLSFNTARHSWATIGMDLNFPIAVISQGLGHNDIRTTQIYLDGFKNDVVDGANDLITG